MKNKGFTVVELMTTFCLIATISILLIQLTLSMKNLYISGDMKTTLLTKQGTMTKKIMDDLNNKELISLNSCGNLCIEFEYIDGSKQLVVDETKKLITYDNYSIKLGDGSKFDTISALIYSESNRKIFKIDIPIKNDLLKGDYGIKIIYQADKNITVDSNITNTFK